MKNRVLLIGIFFFVIFSLITWKLVDVQILEHQQWLSKANSLQKREIKTQPKRGKIYDQRGNPLALNVKAYSIAVDSYNMTKPEVLVSILHKFLPMSEKEIRSLIYRKSYFTWIARQVEYSKAQQIKQTADKRGADGLLFVDSWKRVYPYQKLGGHVLGFTGVDYHGLAGLEYSMDDTLSGSPAVTELVYGADRTAYRMRVKKAETPGHNLHLTMDNRIQHIVQQELEEGVERFQAKKGWSVVIEPNTGNVLAMAQTINYDPNHYNKYPQRTRRNLSVSYTFEPGSIMKAFTALAALDSGIATPDTVVDGDSPVTISGHNIHNAQYKDWGQITFTEAIQNSVNTGIIRIAQRLGENRLYTHLVNLGFGSETEIRIPGEQSGKLRALRNWSDLAIGSIPIGQSISVTALQLASRMAAIANGGRLIPPTLVEKVTSSKGQTVYAAPPQNGIRIGSPESVAQLKNMLRKVVTDGTGTKAAIPGVSVCGKTGTAQKAGPYGGYMEDKYISSFAGFFPKKEPQYLILIILDEVGTTPVWGGATAGQIFHEVATRLITLNKNQAK